MTQFGFRFSFNVEYLGERTFLENHLNDVMTELVELSAVDPSLSVDYEVSSVDVELVAGGSDILGAAKLALSQVRTAIHAAGGNTQDWFLDPSNTQSAELAIEQPISQWQQSGFNTQLVSA